MTKKLLTLGIVMMVIVFLAFGVSAKDKAAPAKKAIKHIPGKVLEYMQQTNKTAEDVAVYFTDFEGADGEWTPENNGAGAGFEWVTDNFNSETHSWWVPDDAATDEASALPIQARIVSPTVDLPTDLDGDVLNQLYVSYWFDVNTPNTAPGDGFVYDVFEAHIEAPFPGENLWHPSEVDAFEGMSWFCGLDETGTYVDDTRQELRTPVLDLSEATGAVLLTFKNFDSIEDNFDYGYVEISPDGGETWIELAVYSEEKTEVAYTDAEFDITSFASAETIVRWRFESDGGYQSPFGWHIDNVEIADESTTYLFDDGGDTQMVLEPVINPLAWARMHYDYDRGDTEEPSWFLQDPSTIFNGFLDITQYAGISVRFALVVSTDGWNRAGLPSGRGFYFDDFGVWGVGRPEVDLAALSIEDPCFVQPDEPITFNLNVLNAGTQAQTQFTWQGRIESPDGTPLGTVVGSFDGNLEPDMVATVPAMTTWTPADPGLYRLVAWTRMPGDIVAENDTTATVGNFYDMFYVSGRNLIFYSQLNDQELDESAATLNAEGFKVMSNSEPGVQTWNLGMELWAPSYFDAMLVGAHVAYDSLGRPQDEWLVIDGLDFSYITHGATLNFYGMGVAGFLFTHFTIDVSTNCGTCWTPVFERIRGFDPQTNTNYGGAAFFRAGMNPASVDLTPYVAGHHNVKIRFRYRAVDDGDWVLWKIGVSGEGLRAAELMEAADVPGDQGKQVRLKWNASLNDGMLEGVPVAMYHVWRGVVEPPEGQEAGKKVVRVAADMQDMISNLEGITPGARVLNGATQEEWEYLCAVPAHKDPMYNKVVSTLYDEVETPFVVSAHTASGVFANSNVVMGMSHDDLPPEAPANFALVEEGGMVKLSWNEPTNEEPAFYSVYRSNTSGVYGEPVETTTSTQIELEADADANYYVVTATDYADNESDPSVELVATSLANFDGSAVPTEYALSQNYPNPFNPTTMIRYQLPEAGKVTLRVVNSLGQEVRTLVDADMDAGYHTISWDGRDNAGIQVSNGIYMYQIKSGNFVATKKMVFMK
ncbi:T9SS type A sorting domain-containing protein [candidate division KSB1 bacterium]|nr:T9SS type A sorting domain-containing protein [candidate division KSB1 bacterium]